MLVEVTRLKERHVKAIEFEARIEEDGSIHVPEEYQDSYGKIARLVVLLNENQVSQGKVRQPGSAKGILTIVSDDDDHLDDFRDYMR